MSGNSESMIERVAAALCREWSGADKLPIAGDVRRFYTDAARAAIEAMREPTEAMLDTMAMRGDPEDLKWVYQQMIDAALSPTGPDNQSGDGEADHG